ncbi:hypothetical protein DVA67_010365 [Solirubrobacter sp. CPCC 204708]|uniref:Uncharacterized protein n=1 Tax=Solirubrobacter deserti TaxID=2282478 RepID=A0ABT4RSK0_9ACTN|nr:HD domain-containing phosphohydrolase [Solirubrobacter deserti]MBE2316381.1 hypothetical protein [Solirubrobacter deserti]MDA0141539.1 hypothetical protein [Solirubrobacter deserti]
MPAFVWLAPPSSWDQPGLLFVLLALAVIADVTEITMPNGLSFDAALELVLITLVLMGPFPAFLVAVLPLAIGGLIRRERIVRQGNLANVAAFGWEALAGAALLSAAGVSASTLGLEALPWLLAAGMVMMVTQISVGPALYAPLYLGHRWTAGPQIIADTAPATIVMLTLAGITVLLYPLVGVLSLALFALVAVVPQTALFLAARTRPVAALDPLAATRRYAYALALHLGLDRAERRHLLRVTELAFARRADAGDPIAYARQTLRDPSRASWEAGHVGEWWNGGGGPAGLRGSVTPIASRIVAVADTWSALTAKGGPELSHADALVELENAAGTRFDPRVVQACFAVVAEEPVSEREPAPVPRLHALRVPAPLRRAIAAG